MPVCAHLVDNCFGLFMHIATVERVNAETDLFIWSRTRFLSLVFLAMVAARQRNLPVLQPCGSEAR